MPGARSWHSGRRSREGSRIGRRSAAKRSETGRRRLSPPFYLPPFHLPPPHPPPPYHFAPPTRRTRRPHDRAALMPVALLLGRRARKEPFVEIRASRSRA